MEIKTENELYTEFPKPKNFIPAFIYLSPTIHKLCFDNTYLSPWVRPDDEDFVTRLTKSKNDAFRSAKLAA